MIKSRCPTCKTPYEVEGLADLPAFPFCSERCRLIDLGRWIDGTNAIPGAEAPALPEGPVDADDD